MSKTDKTRPWWVQMNDVPGGRRPDHGCDALSHPWAPYPCDLPESPHPYTNTACAWEPAHSYVDGDRQFARPRAVQARRRKWIAAERTARRAMLRSLTRNPSDEDVIEHRRGGRRY